MPSHTAHSLERARKIATTSSCHEREQLKTLLCTDLVHIAFSHLWVKKAKQCPACGSQNLLDHQLLGLLDFQIFLRYMPFSQFFSFYDYSRHWSISSPSSDNGMFKHPLLEGPRYCMDHHQFQKEGKAKVSSPCFLICGQISTFTHATWVVLGI